MADPEDEIARRFTNDPGVLAAAEKEARNAGVASGPSPDGARDQTGAVVAAQARDRRGDLGVHC